jgi:hypothetical protein
MPGSSACGDQGEESAPARRTARGSTGTQATPHIRGAGRRGCRKAPCGGAIRRHHYGLRLSAPRPLHWRGRRRPKLRRETARGWRCLGAEMSRVAVRIAKRISRRHASSPCQGGGQPAQPAGGGLSIQSETPIEVERANHGPHPDRFAVCPSPWQGRDEAAPPCVPLTAGLHRRNRLSFHRRPRSVARRRGVLDAITADDASSAASDLAPLGTTAPPRRRRPQGRKRP